MDKTSKQIQQERRDNIISDNNPSLRGTRNSEIKGYVPPSKVNSSNKGNIYSKYNNEGDLYKEMGKSKDVYSGYNLNGYTVQKCFKCNKILTECNCIVKT